MPKFRALEKGFDGYKTILPGEIFESEVSHGLWMELVDKPAPVIEQIKPEPKLKPKKNKLAQSDGLSG